MSVLFVHTDSDDRAMYAEYVRGAGYAVRELGKTDDALPIADDLEVLITGLMVPGTMDPIHFITQARSQSSTLPIVVVTACVMDTRIAQAYAAGANVVLMKPCLPETLLLAVRTLIEESGVSLVPQQPRRVSDERRLAARGGRRKYDSTRVSESGRGALP